jgi:hypothetical protein
VAVRQHDGAVAQEARAELGDRGARAHARVGKLLAALDQPRLGGAKVLDELERARARRVAQEELAAGFEADARRVAAILFFCCFLFVFFG